MKQALQLQLAILLSTYVISSFGQSASKSAPQVQPATITSSQTSSQMTHHYFKTSDGVRLHYVEADQSNGQQKQTLVLIPGWLMPAAVFEPQLIALSKYFRVLALDPRSHGQSELAKTGHDPLRRTRDIDEFLKAAHVQDFILGGWSLGVLESLDYVARFHPANLKGLILIDNSVGEGKPPGGRASNFTETMNDPKKREAYLRKFSKDIFKQPAPPQIADAVVQSALRVPANVAIQLINQPYPRTYWRETLEKQDIPVMYAITPRYKDQGDALEQKRSPEKINVVIFEKAGHTLFVDDPTAFNAAALEFSQKTFASAQQQ